MKKLIVSGLLWSLISPAFGQLSVKDTRSEDLVNPIGLDNLQPEFSWKLSSPARNTMQTAYEIRVGTNAAALQRNQAPTWSTGRVNTDQSTHIVYAGPALKSSTTYYWQVRTWDNHRKQSAWSAVSTWHTAFFQTQDWKAHWIQAGFIEDSINKPSPLFRKGFTIDKKVRSAVLSITSHGLYEAFINGTRISDAYLTPGFTSYNKRLQYQVYDVTQYLQQGSNATGVGLGNGWYRGTLAWDGHKDLYGHDRSLLYQLDIEYADGSRSQVISDDTWKSSTGGVRTSEIYNGETIDARLAETGWNTAKFDDNRWSGVKVVDFNNANLVATQSEPVTKHEVFKPLRIFKTPAGEQVIDFGQNLVGFVEIRVRGKAGDSIRIHHAEVLDKAGNFYTANLRAARQTNVYVLKGGGEESFHPHFTFQGFRYIRIEGLGGDPDPADFTAFALYSDMKSTGSFTTNNALLNQLQHNIGFGQKGNFLDIPTDCPQRDERLGWTGDAQVFSRTAAYNMGVDKFFQKWMKDVAADQLKNGSVPFVVPNVLGDGAAGSAGWADVSTVIPWNMYLVYGDKRILAEQYASMKGWVDYMKSRSVNDLWNTGSHFGDWLFYRPDDDNDGRAAVTDKQLIAQCFYAHSTQLLINAATVLNNQQDIATYSQLLAKIKAAFVREYLTPSGRLVSGTQTAYVLALNFDMLPEELRAPAAERLVANVKDYDYHLTTGFLGTPYLCHVLTRFGYHDVAYTLLMQETYPSWLYPVKMGATTIWERWDGQKPDGSFQTISMNSFNHYAYGAIGDWMYRLIAGIDTDPQSVGYKKIVIRPYVYGRVLKGNDQLPAWNAMNGLLKTTENGSELKDVNATLETNYGRVSSHWKKESGRLVLEVEVPVNTTALVWLPSGNAGSIKESGKLLADTREVVVKETQAGYTVVEVGSGKYVFETE